MSFSISDQMEALIEANGNQMGQGSVFSLTLAEVTDTKDDKNLYRVKCRPIGVPSREVTDWAYVMTPMAGKNQGLFFFPKVGDLVVLGYLSNDPHRPIVLGSFWNNAAPPPYKLKDGKTDDMGLITENKFELTVHDEKGKQQITVKTPSEMQVVIDEKNQIITTKNKGADTSLTMNLKKGEIELKAKSKITLTTGKASITLDQSGNIKIKGNGDIVLDGKAISGNAKAKVELKGANVAVNANADLKLNSSGMASLKGSLLKLN